MENKLFRCRDLFILAFVFLLSLSLFVWLFPRREAREATVCYKGEVLDSFLLDGEEKALTYALSEGRVCLSVDADGVRVTESPCKGQNCVHTGSVDKSGEAIVCLPLGFTVTLSGDGEYDGVTG